MPQIDLREVDFSVVKEDYSRFVLNDGTTLKAKILLRKIFTSPMLTPEGYPLETAFDSVNVVVALVPQSLRGPPSQEPLNQGVEKGEEIRFTTQTVNAQEYVTYDGFRIIIKPVLTKVFRYSKFNPYGEPIYSVVLQQIADMEKTQSTST